MKSAANIVGRLAAADPIGSFGCTICGTPTEDGAQHTPDCPWLLAVEWAASQATVFVLHGVETIESVHATLDGARRAAAAWGVTDDREWFHDPRDPPSWCVGPGPGHWAQITAHEVQP